MLSRHRDEAIVIRTPSGEEIEVMVVDIRGDKCRIGCSADPRITIHRKEVQRAIDREQRRDDNDRPAA